MLATVDLKPSREETNSGYQCQPTLCGVFADFGEGERVGSGGAPAAATARKNNKKNPNKLPPPLLNDSDLQQVMAAGAAKKREKPRGFYCLIKSESLLGSLITQNSLQSGGLRRGHTARSAC